MTPIPATVPVQIRTKSRRVSSIGNLLFRLQTYWGAQARMHSPAEHFCIFFRYYLPYGIRLSPVFSLCWPSVSIAGCHTAAFPGNRPFPFPLKISVYFVFSSRDSGNFTSSDCFDHLIRIRTAKEGRTQDASGLLWLFFLIRNISGKKPDHWIKTVFLDIKRIQALSCV